MLLRTGKRLFDLERYRSVWIIGKAVILSALKSKLGLEEKVITLDDATLNGCCNALTNGGLIIMATLIGRVDTTKAVAYRQLGQMPGLFFFPRGSIEKARDSALHVRYCLV